VDPQVSTGHTIEAKLAAALAAGLDTHTTYHAHGRWTPARYRQQTAVLNALYARQSHVPADGRAMVMGGLGGSGKGKVQRENASLNVADYFVIDPDAIKLEMAARGMIPAIDGLSPMEANPLAHEEASELAKRLARRVYRARLNVLWDITMASAPAVLTRIDDMRKAGYQQVDGVFVDADPTIARERTIRRHSHGQASYAQGQGYGGRWVPEAVSASNAATPGSGYRSRNAEVFASVRTEFNNSVVIDASDGSATSVTGNRFPLPVDTSTEQA
jgi:hypothetical protein